jgi:hypothetical protein
MIIISSKIKLDAMSKVISFSISDRYLDKLRSLYPSLTDNLAAKQFLTDGLESSLGNSLDASLDDGLDDKLKTLIESSLDGILDERLDAVVGKSLTSLSDRLSRLEESSDDSLDDGLDDRVLTLIDSRLNESIARLGSCFSHRLLGLEKRLDDMERLLKLQQSASIAAPIPTGEPSPLPPPAGPAIETVTPEVSPSPPGAIASIDGTVEAVYTVETADTVEPISSIELDKGAIEDWEKKIMEPVGGSDSLDTLPVPLITDKTIDQNAIATVPKTHTAIATRLGLKNSSNLSNWIKSGIPKPYQDRIKVVERNGKKKIEWIT